MQETGCRRQHPPQGHAVLAAAHGLGLLVIEVYHVRGVALQALHVRHNRLERTLLQAPIHTAILPTRPAAVGNG